MTDISESGIEAALLREAIRSDEWPAELHQIVDAVNNASDEHDLSTEQCVALGVLLSRRHPPASREEGLRVKALEWKDRGVWATADCLIGRYEIDDVNGLWHTLGPGGFVSRGHASIPDAKSAAQEHYTNAILSAIETALIPTKPEAKEAR
jgi:hypothetical protein